MRIAYALILATSACGRFGDYDVNVRTSAVVDNGDSDPVLTWQELDGSATGDGITNHASDAMCAHLIASSGGTVYVLWADPSSGAPQAYLRAFTESWQGLDGSADGGGMSQGTGHVSDGTHLTCAGALALDSSENLYAVWQNFDSTQQSIDMRVWNGASWSGRGGSDVGSAINPGNFGWWPSVAIDGNDRPVIAYEQVANPYVVRWDNAWDGVGSAGDGTGLAASDGDSFIPAVVAGAGTDLFAMWGEYTAQADDNLIHAAHWSEAGGWVNLGDVIGHTTDVTVPPQIIAYNNAPLVYWADSDQVTAALHMFQWNGTSWQTLAPPVAQATSPVLRVDSNGHLVMAWTQQDEHTQIHAAWFDGTTWQSLDPSGSSISQASGDADGADLAIDGTNRATIMWRQLNDSGVRVIYGRRMTNAIN